MTLTVTGANDAPVAVADVAQAAEGNVVTVDVLANDSDTDASDVLRVTSTTLISMTMDADGSAIAPGNAAVSFQDGRVIFDPGSDFDFLAEGETATVVINYQMSDDDGSPLTDSASLTIRITGANDRPVATVDSGAITENSAAEFDVLANDSDPNAGTVLRISAASVLSATADAGGAAIALSSASVGFSDTRVTFDPGSDFDFLAAGETATVVIQYTATDDAANALSRYQHFDPDSHRRQ